eukprot:767434-Hanusia_phi.AAC.1
MLTDLQMAERVSAENEPLILKAEALKKQAEEVVAQTQEEISTMREQSESIRSEMKRKWERTRVLQSTHEGYARSTLARRGLTSLQAVQGGHAHSRDGVGGGNGAA